MAWESLHIRHDLCFLLLCSYTADTLSEKDLLTRRLAVEGTEQEQLSM